MSAVDRHFFSGIIIIITLFAQRTQRNKNSELDSRAGQHGSKKATLMVVRGLPVVSLVGLRRKNGVPLPAGMIA